MITGFNTDIEFQGTIYHVQTEDKGVKTPLILSLVYDRGTILASKRSAYNDLLLGEFDEKVLAERLQKQHNLICAAIRTGRIEDLKRMAAKEPTPKQDTVFTSKTAIVEEEIVAAPATVEKKAIAPAVVEKEIVSPAVVEKEVAASPPVEKEIDASVETKTAIAEEAPIVDPKLVDIEALTRASLQTDKIKLPENPPIVVKKEEQQPVPKPDEDMVWDVPIDIVEEMLVEAVHIIEDDVILADEAVEIITDHNGAGTFGDTKLKVRLLGDVRFRSGDAKTLRILVNRGSTGKVLGGAQVIIKVLGSAFVPLIFHTKTENDGVATVHLQLPHFKAGRAAVLIKAIHDGEEADLRRAIAHG